MSELFKHFVSFVILNGANFICFFVWIISIVSNLSFVFDNAYLKSSASVLYNDNKWTSLIGYCDANMWKHELHCLLSFVDIYIFVVFTESGYEFGILQSMYLDLIFLIHDF